VKGVHGLALADLDSDGYMDALVMGNKRSIIRFNDRQGHFTRAWQSLPGSDRQNLIAGDFNSDGSMNIFIAGYDKATGLWLNDGTRRFRFIL
jgi:hypothetical protein